MTVRPSSRFNEVKVAQALMLARATDALAAKHGLVGVPVVLAGDHNAVPAGATRDEGGGFISRYHFWFLQSPYTDSPYKRNCVRLNGSIALGYS
jgi:hypothetical protein